MDGDGLARAESSNLAADVVFNAQHSSQNQSVTPGDDLDAADGADFMPNQAMNNYHAQNILQSNMLSHQNPQYFGPVSNQFNQQPMLKGMNSPHFKINSYKTDQQPHKQDNFSQNQTINRFSTHINQSAPTRHYTSPINNEIVSNMNIIRQNLIYNPKLIQSPHNYQSSSCFPDNDQLNRAQPISGVAPDDASNNMNSLNNGMDNYANAMHYNLSSHNFQRFTAINKNESQTLYHVPSQPEKSQDFMCVPNNSNNNNNNNSDASQLFMNNQMQKQYLPYFLDQSNPLFERSLEQLMLILHTHKCEKSRQRAMSKNIPYCCNRQYCSNMMQVLKHCDNCRMPNCRVDHCASSRDILNHWKVCRNSVCVLCGPVRMKLKYQQNQDGDRNTDKIFQIVNMNQYHNNITINKMPSSNNQTYIGNNLSGIQNGINYNHIAAANNMYNVNSNYNTSNQYHVAAPDTSYSPSMNLSLKHPEIAHNQENQQNQFTRSGEISENNSIEWKKSMNALKRKEVIQVLVSTINPFKDICSIKESIKEELYQYALQTEQEVFEISSTADQYREILFTKVQSIYEQLNEQQGHQPSIYQSSAIEDQLPPAIEVPQASEEPNQTKESPRISPTRDETGTNPCSSNHANDSLNSLPNAKHDTELEKDKPESLGVYSQEEFLTADHSPSFCKDNIVETFLPIVEKLIGNFKGENIKAPVIELNGIGSAAKSANSKFDIHQIHSKLLSKEYSSPFEINTDINLLFIYPKTAILTKKSNYISKSLTLLKNLYDLWSEPIMKQYGYCCNQTYFYWPQDLQCQSSLLCLIGRNDSYYIYNKCIYCVKCFKNIESDSIEIVENIATNSIKVPKKDFKEFQNNIYKAEDTITCSECHLEMHCICVRYSPWVLPRSKYTCDKCKIKIGHNKIDKEGKCSENLSIPILISKFSARNLPSSQLSNFVENYINNFCERMDYRDIATNLEKTSNKKLGRIIVRVLFNQERSVSYMKNLANCPYDFGSKDKYSHNTDGDEAEKVPELSSNAVCATMSKRKFVYKVKNIFVFQEFENHQDICLFAMIVHEYGSDCPEPNRNRVYISYIDSIKYFEPSCLRTKFYHNIILSYLLYAKKKGFNYAHIWSCPPGENDDYVFYKHPSDQKVPTVKMLSDWYLKMIKQGIESQTIESYYNLSEYVKINNVNNIMDLPYFDCDFWPNALEDLIKQVYMDKNKNNSDKKLCEVSSSESLSEENQDIKSISLKPKKKKTTKSSKYSVNKKSGQNLSLYDRVCNLIDKYKDIFFVIVLSSDKKQEIHDTDHNISCELMDGRDSFLTFAREGHFEFSTIRRAMYSTMQLLHQLHLQLNESLDCNLCNKLIEGNYYNCKTCDDFDMCEDCFKTNSHEHDLVLSNSCSKMSFNQKSIIGSGSSKSSSEKSPFASCSQNNADSSTAHPKIISKHALKAYDKLFVHSILCVDGNCYVPNCAGFKTILLHYKKCAVKRSNVNRQNTSASNAVEKCSSCKFLNALLVFHAKYCQILPRDSCPVPKCKIIHERLEKQAQQREDRERAFLRSRMNIAMKQASIVECEENQEHGVEKIDSSMHSEIV